MKKCAFLVFLVLLIAVFSVSFTNAQIEHPKTGDLLIIECGMPPGPVKIDGKLDEWKHATPVAVDVEEQLYSVFQGDWTGPEDCSGVVYMMYDEDYVYVAGEFKDEKLIAGQTGGNIWMNECLEIFFDSQDILTSGHQHYQFGFAPSGPGDKPQVWDWCNENAAKSQRACDSYVKLASVIADPYTGYTLEASIQRAEMDVLNKVIETGAVIGFHIAIDDADDNTERDLQITWSSFEAHDQMNFGDLVFAGPLAVSPAGAVTAMWGQIKKID